MLRPSVAIAGRHATLQFRFPISSPRIAVSCGTLPPFSLQTACATCHHWFRKQVKTTEYGSPSSSISM